MFHIYRVNHEKSIAVIFFFSCKWLPITLFCTFCRCLFKGLDWGWWPCLCQDSTSPSVWPLVITWIKPYLPLELLGNKPNQFSYQQCMPEAIVIGIEVEWKIPPSYGFGIILSLIWTKDFRGKWSFLELNVTES